MAEFIADYTIFYTSFLANLGNLWLLLTGNIIGQILIYCAIITAVIVIIKKVITGSNLQ